MNKFYPTVIVVILDQLSKLWIKFNFNLYESRNVLGDFLRFSYVENPGIAFGIRLGSFRIIITILSFLIALYIAYLIYSQIKLSMFEEFSLALILGGAIGNLIDRLLIYVPSANYSGVIDFIDVGIGLNRWYIFNIADSAVTVGIIIYLIYSTFLEDKKSLNAG